jgi:DNA-directed RNA polymerase specialized sigma24 family protein
VLVKSAMMLPDQSVSRWISNLKVGEADAAHRLWNHFAIRLVELARQKLGDAPKGVADEEDVAQSVFQSVCRAAADGRFHDLHNRDDLWWLLLAITNQKAIDHIRRETADKRGSGRVQTEGGLAASAPAGEGFALDHIIGKAPTPDFLVMLEEQNQRLLGKLRDDRLRRVAICRMEGYTVAEIAAELDVSTRSIERKLQLIRTTWARDLASADECA